VLHYTFNTPKALMIDSVSSIPLDTTGSSAPYSVKDGGKYCNGALFLQMPGPQDVRQSTSFAMTFWVRVLSSTTDIMAFFSKKVSTMQNSQYNDDLTFGLNKSNFFILAESYNSKWLATDDVTTYFAKWNKVHISVAYNAPNTNIKVSINGFSETFTLQNLYFKEDTSTVNWLCRRQSSAASTNQWFNGMIYEFIIYNYAAPYASSSSASYTQCKSNQFDSVCTDCVNCVTCVRTTDCGLCADSMCSVCNDFSKGSCTLCLPGATLSSGACTCPSGQYKLNNKCSSKD
jgi:hypothetical protein